MSEKYPTNCEYCGCQLKNKFDNYNHKRRSDCYKEQSNKKEEDIKAMPPKRGRPPLKKQEEEADDNNALTEDDVSNKDSNKKRKTIIYPPFEHFKSTLPTLVNMLIENDNDPTCLKYTLKADPIFREHKDEIEDFAKSKAKESTTEINKYMSEIKKTVNEGGGGEILKTLTTSCYEKEVKEDGYTWKLSDEKLAEQLSTLYCSIAIIENVMKIRKHAPYKIACEYIEKNIGKLNRKGNSKEEESQPSSASQLFD